MRVIVVGMGVQGLKRVRVAGKDCVATVDPVNRDAQYKLLEDVPLEDYDAALLCVPDQPKISLLRYLANNRKSVLVEKPLFADNHDDLILVENLARKNGVVIYTAYNHRFEPHFIQMRNLIKSGSLGNIFSCRLFYGNGTARLVRNSEWRDTGAGVLPDLGSHMIDLLSYWFDPLPGELKIVSSNCFENKASDHVVIGSFDGSIRFEIELTLLMWRNHFTCDILASKGSAHIESLCKWGPSKFIHRERCLPSGKPKRRRNRFLECADPTWENEYNYFKQIIANNENCSLKKDIWLNQTLSRLAVSASERQQNMTNEKPKVGIAGLTHLGVNTGTAVAHKGFSTVWFDNNEALCEMITRGNLGVTEPGLVELFKKTRRGYPYLLIPKN